MIWEVARGRVCDSLQRSQADLIRTMGIELTATGTALKLSTTQIITLESMIKNLQDYALLNQKEYTLKEKGFKAVIRKLWVWVISEGVIIVLLII